MFFVFEFFITSIVLVAKHIQHKKNEHREPCPQHADLRYFFKLSDKGLLPRAYLPVGL